MWYTDGRDNKKISFSMQPNAKKAVFITEAAKGDVSMEDGQIIVFWRRNEQAVGETDRKCGILGRFPKTFWQTSPTAKKTSTIPICRRGINPP